MNGSLKVMPLVLVLLLSSVFILTDGSDAEDLFSISMYNTSDDSPLGTDPLIRDNISIPFDTDNVGGVITYRVNGNFDLTEGRVYLKSTASPVGYNLSVSVRDAASLGTSFITLTGLRITLYDMESNSVVGTAVLDSSNGYSSSFLKDDLASLFTAETGYRVSITAASTPDMDSVDTVVNGLGFTFTATLERQMTVTFDPNGGTVSSGTKTVSYGESYGDLPSASRSGYRFAGWFTSSEGGVQVTSSSIVQTFDDHTLYAHWSYIPIPSPDPKPEPPTPPEPEHSELESIGEDGSKTETEKETTVDGDRTTVVVKETNTKTDGSSIISGSKTVTESTETGSESITESISISKDPQGNIMSVAETTTKVTIDGDSVTTIVDSVVRDPDGNIISEDRSESTEVSKGEGRKESSSSITTVTSEGTVTKATVSQITDKDGNIITSSVTSEVHRDNDGNRIKTVTTESQMEETIVSGGKVTKVDSTVVTKDSDGNILANDKVTEERSITVSGKETTTSSNTVTESRDADGNLIGITESVSETRQSPGSDIVTDFTERFTTSDGQTKVVEGVSSTAGDYSITTVAVTITEHGDSSSNAKTTLNYLGTAILDAPDVDLAYDHSVKTTSSMGMEDVERNVRVTSGNGVSAVATGAAFGKMSSLGMGLYIEGSIGSLRYDPDACGSFASSGRDVTITMLKDAVDVLTEAQKEVVGKTGFVSVSAYAGAEYVTDLGGTVTISFTFDMGQGSFAAFYVADDGSTEQVPFTYDSRSGAVSMISGHHSVYAMLPVEEPVPADRNESGLWVAGIIIVLAAVILAVIVVRRRS